jgi:DNA mismatch repair protein MSH2
LTKLRTLVQRCNVIVTERKPVDFMTKNVEQDLKRLLTESYATTALRESTLGVC